MKEPIKHRRKFKEAKVSFVWVEGELCRSWKKSLSPCSFPFPEPQGPTVVYWLGCSSGALYVVLGLQYLVHLFVVHTD